MPPTLFSLLTLTLTLLLLHQPPFSAANLHHTTSFHRSHPIPTTPPPTTFFQVTKPIPLPKTKPFSHTLLHHTFANSYGKSPVLANYTPPSTHAKFSKIVLQWNATSKGRQFDRIFGVWLGGVEILRSCTAEPRPNGVVWTVEKDVTRYYSLFMTRNQTLAVYIGNIVDHTYTGVYHVHLTLLFYPAAEENYGYRRVKVESFADLILPISRDLPLSDGLWFEIQNSTHVESKRFGIPRNAYRAVLEVYVSFHENDEFWYGNFPNEYVSLNNLTGTPANGPFREVVVRLDDNVVGAVFPFTVIYTGGINPLLWRPITAIGSFDLPSYDIEITPLLGILLDGKKSHEFSFSVTDALNVWYVDANLHLWLDEKSEKTQGKLLKHEASPLSVSRASNFSGFDGRSTTDVMRSIYSSGWVNSSHGMIRTESHQGFKYTNDMVLGNEGNLQTVDQFIHYKGRVLSKTRSSSVTSTKSSKKFRIHLYSNDVDKGNGSYASVANVTLGVEDKVKKSSGSRFFASKIKNRQNGEGYMLVKNNSVVGGVGSTKQEYQYSDDDNSCYLRNVRSSNYTILNDEESNSCTHHRQ